MDQLKKLLRLAIAEQATCLALVSGREPELSGAGMPKLVTSEGRIDAAFVKRLYTFLFPTELGALSAGEITKGLLQVPNVGRIHLIAEPQPVPSLRLYLPPGGAALFASDWQKRSIRAANNPVVPPVPPTLNVGPPLPLIPPGANVATQPPPAQGVRPATPLYGVASHAGEAATLAPQSQAANAPLPYGREAAGAAASAKDSGDVFGYGFIPVNLGIAPTLSPVEAPRAAVASQPSPPAATVIPTAAAAATQLISPMPNSGSMRISLDEPETNGSDMEINVFSAAQPVQGQLINHHQASSATELAPAPVISFAPTQPGEAAMSSGQNAVDAVLAELVKKRGSDLHLTCGEPMCFRLDGDIVRQSKKPVTPAEMEAFLLPLMPQRNIAEFATINDTDFAYEIRGLGRFRVNIFRDKNGVGSVMRHIPSTILTAEQLQLPPAITRFCALHKGLVLVTGPTGSGKSTTLAAMIDSINKQRSDHILTVEDPIEFVHSQQRCLINQREVHRHTGSFARALKAALREDPDIVLIGEMRDLETVAIAIETAETGHLVFGTLHTNTAVSTIDRIVDQFPTDRQEQVRMMLASSLRGVVAQTLLKKKGGGRVAAHEILVTNDAVSAMIREGKSHMLANHMQSQKADGNILLNESLTRLVKDGTVEAEEALKKAVDKNSLGEMLKRAGIKLA